MTKNNQNWNLVCTMYVKLVGYYGTQRGYCLYPLGAKFTVLPLVDMNTTYC